MVSLLPAAALLCHAGSQAAATLVHHAGLITLQHDTQPGPLTTGHCCSCPAGDNRTSNEPADLSAAAAALARPNDQRVPRPVAPPSQGNIQQDSQQVTQMLSTEGGADELRQSLAAQMVNSALSAPLSLGSSINAETLETAAQKYSAHFKAPNEKETDKIFFIMNNLTPVNVESKAKELRPIICPEYLNWFANYLVVKRAAQEPNLHPTYIKLLDTMDHKDLNKLMIHTVHYYAKALLESDRAITQTNERTLIKQLGTWLGLLTFAKNKPILAKHMDLKAMITDAYQRGRMIAVLPFVQKVLETCKDSKVFKASNPMMSGILSLLSEIHKMDRLKLNNSFNIEMIYKTFSVQASDVKPSDMLKDLPRVMVNNPDFSAVPEQHQKLTPPPPSPSPATQPPPPAATGPVSPLPTAGPTPPTPPPPQVPRPGPPMSPEVQAGQGGLPVQPSPPPAAPGMGPPAASASPGGVAPPVLDQSLFANLHGYVQISPNLSMYEQRLQLRRIVPVAVDRAICEIITPVVERSVTIACMTTYELVVKDFALDPDENRLRQAAHLMVSSMAGSLALVTCKEPLRLSLSSQLRNMLQNQESQNVVEHIVQVGALA